MKVTVYKKNEISSAHFLPQYEGKCKYLHGHNYIVEVWARGEDIDMKHGILLDFASISELVDKLDHESLNDFISNPTAENIALYFLEALRQYNSKLHYRVRVWETSTSFAEVTNESE